MNTNVREPREKFSFKKFLDNYGPEPGVFRLCLILVIVATLVLFVVLPFFPDAWGDWVVYAKENNGAWGTIMGGILAVGIGISSLMEVPKPPIEPEPPAVSFKTHADAFQSMSQRLLEFNVEAPMQGGDVKVLKKALDKAGYPLTLNDIFDEPTDKAVRTFQKDNGMTIDGKAGVRVRAKLHILHIVV